MKPIPPQLLARTQTTAAQHPNAIVSLLDKAGKIAYTTPNSEKLIGYAPSERIGRNGLKYLLPSDADLITIAFQDALLTGESVEVGATYITKSGGRLPVRAMLYALTDDDSDEVFVLARMVPAKANSD